MSRPYRFRTDEKRERHDAIEEINNNMKTPNRTSETRPADRPERHLCAVVGGSAETSAASVRRVDRAHRMFIGRTARPSFTSIVTPHPQNICVNRVKNPPEKRRCYCYFRHNKKIHAVPKIRIFDRLPQPR